MTHWMQWGRMWPNVLSFSSDQVLKQPNNTVDVCVFFFYHQELLQKKRKKNHNLLQKLVELTKAWSDADACEYSCLRNNSGPHVPGSVMSLQPCGLQLQEIPSQCCQPREKYSSLVLTEGDPEHESPIVSFLPHSDPTLSMQRNHTHPHWHSKLIPWGINSSANWWGCLVERLRLSLKDNEN